MKNTRRITAATATALALSLAGGSLASAATVRASDGSTTIPSTIKVSRKHTLNTDKVIAQTLGITVTQLRSEIASGATIAEIAAAHGSSASAVATAIKTKVAALVKKAVAARVIARAKAASTTATIGATVSGLMNRAPAFAHRIEANEVDLLSLTVVANTLGVTVDALKTELKTGISILTAATNHSVTEDALVAAIRTDAETKIAAAVTAGTITQAKADEITAGLSARITSWINRVHPAEGRGRRGRENERRQQKPLKLSDESVVARVIGITKDQLETERKAGNSYATIAAAHNVTLDALKAGITTEATARITAALAAGRITQTQADTMTTALPTWVDDFVNRVPMPEAPRPTQFRLVSFAAAATFIGITQDALRTQVKGGVSVGQVAVNNGKTVADLTAALTADSTTRVAAAVTAGIYTQAQADLLLAQLPAAIDAFVNQVHYR